MGKPVLISFPACSLPNNTKYASYAYHLSQLGISKSLLIDFRDPNKCIVVAPIANWDMFRSIVLIEPSYCDKLFMNEFKESLKFLMTTLGAATPSYTVESHNELNYGQLIQLLGTLTTSDFKISIIEKLSSMDNQLATQRKLDRFTNTKCVLGWRCNASRPELTHHAWNYQIGISSTHTASRYIYDLLTYNHKQIKIVNSRANNLISKLRTYFTKLRSTPALSLHHIHNINYIAESSVYDNTNVFLLKTDRKKIVLSFVAAININMETRKPDAKTLILMQEHQHNIITLKNFTDMLHSICKKIYALAINHGPRKNLNINICTHDAGNPLNHKHLVYQCNCKKNSSPNNPVGIPCLKWISQTNLLNIFQIIIILHIPNSKFFLDCLCRVINRFPKYNIKWIVSGKQIELNNPQKNCKGLSIKTIEFEEWEQNLCDSSWHDAKTERILTDALLNGPNIKNSLT